MAGLNYQDTYHQQNIFSHVLNNRYQTLLYKNSFLIGFNQY